MPLGKRKTADRRHHHHRPPRETPAERTAKALERIDKRLARIEKHQADKQFTDAELEEMFTALSSGNTASNDLQARLRKAIGVTNVTRTTAGT